MPFAECIFIDEAEMCHIIPGEKKKSVIKNSFHVIVYCVLGSACVGVFVLIWDE